MRFNILLAAAFALGTLPLPLLGGASTAYAKGKRVSKKKPKKMNTMSPRFSHDGKKISYEFHIPKKKVKGVHICGADGTDCKANSLCYKK